MSNSDSQSDPMREAVFSLLPHFGIKNVVDIEDGIAKLRVEMERVRSEEPERYAAVLTQALEETKAFADVLNQYGITIEKVKSE